MEPWTNLVVSIAFFGLLAFIFTTLRKTQSNGSYSSHGKVKILTQDYEFEQELKDAGGKPVVVDFTASWCGPCQKIAPLFSDLSGEYGSKVVFLKVDVDQLKDTAKKHGIRAMPTFVVFKNEKKVDEVVGAAPEPLRNLVQKYAR